MLKSMIGAALSILGGITMVTWYEARRRLAYAALLGVIGFILLMSSVIIGIVDMAVQYEAQGLIFWSAVLWACVGLFLAGVFCLMGSKLALPVRRFR